MAVTTEVIFNLTGPIFTMLAILIFLSLFVQLPAWHSSKWGRSIFIMAVAILGVALNIAIFWLDEFFTQDFTPFHFWPRFIAWLVVGGVYLWKAWVAFQSLRSQDE